MKQVTQSMGLYMSLQMERLKLLSCLSGPNLTDINLSLLNLLQIKVLRYVTGISSSFSYISLTFFSTKLFWTIAELFGGS